MKKANYFVLFILWLSFWLSSNLFHPEKAVAIQDTTKTQLSISTRVSQTKVPLNREVQLTVILSWIGTTDRYTITDFENPAITNFEIVGTATTSRSERNKVYKDYVYALKPDDLGMGYVEGVMVKAHDNVLDQDESLMTQRIPIQVVEPVPEPGESGFGMAYIFIIIGAMIAGVALFWWTRKRKRQKYHQEEEPAVPIETRYLEELKTSFDLNQPNLREDFSRLSKLLRRYLKEKYGIRAMETTTDELIQQLEETALEENRIRNIREILERSNEIKFSGIDGTADELSRFYTYLEGMLESNLHQSETLSKNEQEE